MIEKFVARSILYNEQMMRAVTRISLRPLDVEVAASLEQLADRSLALVSMRE